MKSFLERVVRANTCGRRDRNRIEEGKKLGLDWSQWRLQPALQVVMVTMVSRGGGTPPA